ncbi:hypothetical protein MXD63_24300, partial [Frankia sp. Cpl3]|nr:hypothetical protein [Frankia sp. Cpl3]
MDDIELSRLDAGKILLKATRLARFTGAEETREWLSFELRGYDTSTLSHTYMDKTGRWIDKDSSRGYYNSLASIDALINQYQAELSSAQFGGISGQSALLVT